MSFGVDSQNEWKCWTHSDGRSALQLIAVIKRIRDWECGWRDAGSLQVCVAACDEYSSDLNDEGPLTVALKGVCEVQNPDYPAD